MKMGIKELMTNIRVEVYPRDAGDLGFAHIGHIARSDEDELKLCKDIATSIKRHVDDIGFASPKYDIVKECEYCGANWTEASDKYNGGCCDEDEKNAPKETK
jgi:hypothetical protein